MAGPCTCHNSPPTSDNELAINALKAPTKSSGTPTPTRAVSCVPTLAPAQVFAPAQALAPVPDPPGSYTDEDLQRATKLAVNLYNKGQEHGQLQANSAPQERPLKVWFPDLYYGNLHLDYY